MDTIYTERTINFMSRYLFEGFSTSFGTLARDITMAAPAALVTANNHSAPITAAQRIILVKRKQAENKRQSIKEAALLASNFFEQSKPKET